MDTWPGGVITLLTGGMIGPLTDKVINGLAGILFAGTLVEVCVADVVLAMIILEGVEPVSYAADEWSGTAFLSNIGVSADVNANVWATAMAILEFITLLTSSSELLWFRWIVFCCRSIAATLGCRGLQA